MTDSIALRLLANLGIKYYTKRHVGVIVKELNSSKLNAKNLLDKLGNWDENDLAITEIFINDLFKI